MKPGKYRRSLEVGQGKVALGRLFAVALACLAGGGAQAQDRYECTGLATHDALPAVQGRGGVFFRITPDLQADQGLSDHSISLIAELSAALDAGGTTLVLLPLPGRALVMSNLLPPMAGHLGYDADIARAVHLDALRRLDAAGIAAADPLAALRRAIAAGDEVFFATDPRPTPAGARAIAESLAEVLSNQARVRDLSRGEFTTAEAPPVELPSAMRAQLQLACRDTLAPVSAPGFVTTASAATPGDGIIAVIGTDATSTEALNFAGFLSAASGLPAGTYGVAGGGAFAALNAYLTSADFALSPPDVLIWEFPLSSSLAAQGDQPLRELIAAVRRDCKLALPLRPGSTPNERIADLSGLPAKAQLTLALDTGGVAADHVRFHLQTLEGLQLSRGIWRHEGQILTGRFFLPLKGLPPVELREVKIDLPTGFGADARLDACIGGTRP